MVTAHQRGRVADAGTNSSCSALEFISQAINLAGNCKHPLPTSLSFERMSLSLEF